MTTTDATPTTTEAAATVAATADDRPILVIGASGKTGRRVASALADLGAVVRPASRHADVRFDWHDADTWAAALAGTRAAYIVPPEEPADIDRFLASAERAGLERLVLLSARHPGQGGDGLVPAVEASVIAGPIPATVLQPAWFSQNFTEGMFVDELAGGVLQLPVGDGREPFIDTSDIAAVAVAALTEEGHAGMTYEMSGPELLSFGDAVERLGRASGRDLRFEPVELDAWTAAASGFLPPPVVDLLANLFTAISEGANDHLSPGVEAALGRPARSFDDALAADRNG